jgi:hypothetical protein
MGDHVRTASNAPGALPASPTAARSFSVSHRSDGQKVWSDSTYETPNFGYAWSPKSLPKALLPSTRRPAVKNSRSRHASCSWTKNPALITRGAESRVTVRRAAVTNVGGPGPARSSPTAFVWCSLSSKSWPPHEALEVSELLI